MLQLFKIGETTFCERNFPALIHLYRIVNKIIEESTVQYLIVFC